VALQDGTDTVNISTNGDHQFVDDFLERVIDLAQEHVGTQSKFSAQQLLELAGFRFPAKGDSHQRRTHRPSCGHGHSRSGTIY
jgi:hypothetical protein